MKLFTQWRFILLSALFSLLGIGSAWAQLTELEVGGVYHFTNVGYPAKAMVATTPSSIAGVTADNTNKAQLWYVADEQVKEGVTYYALRNLGYGTYLQGNGQSSAWTLANTTDSDKSWFALTLANGKTAIRSYNERSNNHGFAHIDGGSNVVGWSTDAQATQWNISKIEMSSADIQTALGIFGNVASYQTALDALFTDKACTELKVTFDENNASFNALHPTLQNMVRKVAGTTSWEEANKDNTKESWGADYAKKYRVQLYEPYNDAGAAASALGLNAHNSLNNPTGIFANNGDVLYVMVDGEIKEGASLYLAYYTGHGKLDASSKVGYELKQGLNVIPVYQNSSNFCVNYVVQTFDTSDGKKGNKAKARKLSDYKPIKIHIEGGYINGYWNKVGDALYTPDTYTTWEYIEARATQTDVTVLGKYITLQFPLLDENTYDGDNNKNKGLASYFNELVNIEDCINEWDNVMLWERLLLGVLDSETTAAEAKKSPYSVTQSKDVFEYTGNETDGFESGYGDYYNIHGLSLGTPTGYMYGGWDHCGYHYNTMGGVIKDLPTSAGAHWGPGHEIGHQHQNLLTVNGLTEVTNNLFSNVVLWYFGETTSRYNGSEGALSNVLAQFNAEGTDFFSNNIWAQTIMYYKLFLYYHVLGHNPKFYPRLFEMLRQDPMSTGYAQDGSTCLMHFYKKCCLAAGEDLTEFFRAHGFFEVMDNRLVGDYSNSVYTLTQEQIDAAIKEVKDLKYEENLAVLFINDATGETITSHKGDPLEKYGETTICSEIGSYASFATATTPSYNYAISGNTVTMEGSGGVGFAILNENGELIGFSDKKTFEISAEAAAAIASGKASIVTLNADNTPVAATNVMDTGNTEEKYELLGELLGSAKQLLDLKDETGTKVGYYRASSLTKLQEAYGSAKAVYDAQTVAAYSAMYDVLYQEYANLLNNDYARVNITEGYAYRLTNKAYPGRSMAVNTENNQMSGIETAESNAQLWYFEAGASPGTYYLKNKATSLYPGDVSTGAVLNADKSDKTTDNGAHAYNLQNMGNGVFALVGKTGLHCSSSQSYNIVGWGTDADATQWYITATALDEALEARTKLEELVGKAEALINEVGTVEEQGIEPITLTADAYYCNARCINTQWDKFSSYSVLNDGNIDTYLHTDYSGDDSEDGYAHYIRMDVGESSKVQMFKINYTTRNYLYPTAPTSITVEGSNDLTTWEPIETNFTEGLPTDKGTAFTTPTFGNGIKYRYIRLVVNSNDSNQEAGPEGNKHKYFALSELGISKVNYTTALNATYNTINSKLLSDLYSGMLEANGTLATSSQADVLNAAYTTLYTTYKALLDAKTGVENTALTAKKAELQTLINKTKALIGECGSVVNNKETTPQLNITAAPYLLTDNNGASRGSLDKLYDGLQGEANSYTSNWESTPTKPSYLQVDLGTGKEEEKLIFTFTNRNEGDAPTPTEIVVSASADGNEFTELATFTSAEPNWPPAANKQNIAATKWTSPEIKATSACRYWRFTVTKSQRNSGGETNANGIYHFGISEFGIVIPAGCKVTVNEGMGGVTKELLLATYDENQEAQSTHDYATTEVQVDKAIANLQAQYDALTEAKENTAKADLKTAIDAAQAAINACASSITQEGGEYTVVWNFETAGDVDKATLIAAYEALVQANAVYNGDASTVSEYQAAKEALGTPITTLNEYKAGYHKAQLKSMVDLLTALIEKCNTEGLGDLTTGVLEEMVQLNETATAYLTQEFATQEVLVSTIDGAISNIETNYPTWSAAQQSTAKKDLRAMIAELAELIDECGTVTEEGSEYVATVDPNAGSVTEELLISAARAKAAAEEVANTSTDQAALIAEKDKLTSHCEALQEALATKLYPVTITTDEANPVLYTMKSRRGDNKAVQYLPADGHKFNISDMSTGSAVQAYYFTEGTVRGQVYVHPYAARGMVLAANDTGDGADKAFATEMGSATYEEWKFVEATENGVKWYSLQPVGTSTYFSNYGGVSNKMGFYSYADEGSRLQFVSTTVEGSVAYNTLKSYYDGLPGTIEGNDDKVGYYPVTQATAYNQAYNQATMVLNYGGTPVESTILSAGDLVASTTARVIGINSIWLDNYDKWVNELGYIADLGFDQVISLEPVTEGQAGSYYLKMVHAGEMGYFQTSGYTIGAKETAQVFVPIAASTSGTGNAQYNNTDWDNSGNSDATKLVRFVRGSSEGTDWLNPGSRTYANGKGPWTVFNVHALEFTTTEDQYFAAYEALKSAYEGMAINLPKEGGYYTIQSVSRGEGKFAYANPADNKMYWGGKTATSSEVVWKFEDNGDGTYTVSNMHTGTMMNTFINNDASPLNPSSGSVTLKSLAPDGQIGIYSGNQMMHAQGSGSGEIVHWATGANDASAWRIVETDLSNVKYDLTISKYGLAGLHLNYPVEVPDDVNVTAYYVSMAEGANGIAKLTKIKDGIIPANEGVILEGTENATISLPYVSGDVDAISENLLEGANYTSYIQGEGNTKYYLFGAKSGKVGLYWTYLQYNADGDTKEYDKDGNVIKNNANTDDGTHFKCSANKVYLPYSDGSGVAKFSFRFDDTTGIDDLLNGLNGEELIYDLQGRRIMKVTESGIYVVNGQKRYIHAK